MRQSEFKKRYNPVTGKFTKQNIWDDGIEIVTGEGITDKFKSLISGKLKKSRKKLPTLAPKPTTTTSKKAGDRIVKMLSKTKLNSEQDINNKVLSILSGGK